MASGSVMNDVTLAATASTRAGSDASCLSKLVTRLDLAWALIACTAVPLSLTWDFSWESSIGVDRIWSPPHVATQVAVWLCGILALKLIGVFSLARRRGTEVPGVNLGPFSAPSGTWVLLWSVLLFEANIPLDLWWQRAYGLGAGLWPPPQILKTVSFVGMIFGGLLLAMAHTRSSSSSSPERSEVPIPNRDSSSVFNYACVSWLGGTLVTFCALVLVMLNYPNRQHTSSFYLVSSAVYPAVLLLTARGSGWHWGATTVSLSYLAAAGAMVWLLPLFPGHPLTPPIHNPITRMLPPPFPLLLVVPSFALDLLLRRFSETKPVSATLGSSLAAGTVFFALFAPVQWFFAHFLLSPAADNWFFAGGGRHWPYFLKIDHSRVLFWNTARDMVSVETFVLAAALASASAWLGLSFGGWLRKVRR
jgi:hypothetical protein